MDSKLVDQMWKEAQKASQRAYSPYSKFKVGSSLLANNGKIFAGCNVENASYGGTVCAERVAIFKALSEGFQRFESILIYTDQEEPWPPCGICRQVMSEFCLPETPVLLANSKGVKKTLTLGELLPYSFVSSHLKEN